MGPCAKARVTCTIRLADGRSVVGENWCANPQAVCPRTLGEDYTKCKTVCLQEGHAEIVALRLARGQNLGDASATLRGHTYFCMDCQHALFGAGVQTLTVAS